MKRQSPECTHRNGNPAIPLRRGFFLVWLMQPHRPDTGALIAQSPASLELQSIFRAAFIPFQKRPYANHSASWRRSPGSVVDKAFKHYDAARQA
jgi:hypothetical protein